MIKNKLSLDFVTGVSRNTLYAPTSFYRNVRNIRSAIPAIFTISAISVAISATSAISAIFVIPETSAVPALSTC